MTPFELFQAALEYSAQQAQDEYIDRQCEHNPTLRSEVKSLLRAHREAKDFLDEDSAKTHRVIETVQQLSQDVSSREAASSRAIQRIKELLGTPVNPDAIAAIDHYSLLNAIGVGGFGVVFRAVDEKLQRLVAVKMLTPHSESTASPCRRFLQEARSAAAVNHENVVRIHDVEESPIPYIVMEYVNGPTLHQFIQEVGPLEINSLVSLSRQIASGLAAAHQCGFIHRDIKPGNILVEVGSELKIKLTDFGLAQTVEDVSLSSSEQFIGTPLYASPEQARSLEIDARSDLFSLGSVMYQMACGQPPFRATSSQEVLQQVRFDTPKPIQQIRPSIPAWFCRIVERLHEKSPESRIQSASQLAKLLHECERSIQDASRIVDQSDLMQPQDAATKDVGPRPITEQSTRTVESVSSPTSSDKHRWIRAVAMGSVFGALGLGGTWWWSNQRTTEPDLNTPKVISSDSPKETSSTEDNRTTPTTPRIPNVVQQSEAHNLPPWMLPSDAPRPLVIPTEADEVRSLQAQWAKYLQQPSISKTDIGLALALVPPGEFEKTFTRNRDGEIQPSMPTLRFRMTEAYRMSTTEVTVGQFKAFVDDTGYKTDAEQLGFACDPTAYLVPKLTWDKPGRTVRPEEPVNLVTENDAANFCDWLSKKENRRFRLPTEAEWIHACRAGSASRYVYGPDAASLEFVTWTIENSGEGLNPVGALAANPLGLHDMLGNVWERTADWLDHHAMLPYIPRINPKGAPISNTIGGCYVEPRQTVHADLIVGNWSTPSATIGFRIVEEIGDSKTEDWQTRSLVPRSGQPLSLTSLTTKPAAIKGLASWSLCLTEMQSSKPSTPAWNTLTKQWIVGGDEGSLTVLNADGTFAEKLLGPCNLTEVKISADGRWVIAKDSNGSLVEHLYVWNWPDRKLKLILPMDGRFWTISPDSSKIVFAKQNRGPWNNWGAYELDLTSGLVRSLKLPRLVDVFEWTHRPNRVLCQTRIEQQPILEVLDYPSLQLISSIPIHRLKELSVSPDGSRIAIPEPSGKAVRIRELDSLAELTSLDVGDLSIQHCQWFADNDRLLVTGEGASKVFRTSTREELYQLDSSSSFNSSPNLCEEAGVIIGPTLATRCVATFDANTGRFLGSWDAVAPTNAAAVLTDQTIHIAQGETVRSFDLKNGEKLTDIPWHLAPWATANKSATIAALDNGQLVQRNLTTGDQKSAELPLLKDIATKRLIYSNDGKRIAIGFDEESGGSRIVIIDVIQGDVVCELENTPAKIDSLRWSSDDQQIAALCQRESLELVIWDTNSGKQVCASTLPAQRSGVMVLSDQVIQSAASSDYLVAMGTSVFRFGVEQRSWKALINLRLPTVERAIWKCPDQTRYLVSYGARYHHLYDSKSLNYLGEVQSMSESAYWTKDGKTIVLLSRSRGVQTFDASTLSPIGSLIPSMQDNQWMICSPDGFYRGSQDIHARVVYVAMHDDGSQRTYSPSEFEERFGWKNMADSISLVPSK